MELPMKNSLTNSFKANTVLIDENILECEHCNAMAFVAAIICLIVAVLLALPLEGLAQSIQNPQTISAKSKKSLLLNEQGAKAASKNEIKKAENLLKEALAADDQNLSAVFNLASVYITQKKHAEAIGLLELYIKRNVKDVGLLVRLGDAQFDSQNLKKAEEAYQNARKLDPEFKGLSKKLGTVYSLLNKLDLSEDYFELASKNEPKDATLFGNLASIKLANGKISEAIANAKRAIQINPSQQVYVTLGTAYEMQKDYAKSLIAFERARDLGDDRSELEQKIQEIRKLSS